MMRALLFALLGLCLFGCKEVDSNYVDWSDYLGDPARSHYSTLLQIDSSNLNNLQVTWTYATPDTGQMQMNPIIVNGKLFGVSSGLRAFALDAKTGEELWVYGGRTKKRSNTSRGVTYWTDGEEERIFFAKWESLIALDANSGQLIPDFGDNGKVDLRKGLPEVAKDKYVISNTPGAIYGDLLIMPVRVSEGLNSAPGDIRAFNVRDGSLAWTFHVIPYPGEEGYDTWVNKDAYKNTEGIGGGNNWSGMTVDVDEGVLYIPTGSLAPDFYGANRPGTNLFSNCLLAIDAEDGSLLWYQQLTHHDLWDRDLPAPPNLMTLKHNGRKVDAVVQITKQGFVYAFDKKTGEPFHDIREIEVPPSRVESTWPTQPIPVTPEPFARLSDEITEDNVSPFAPNKEELRQIIKKAHREFYAPPDTIPTLLLPGYDGAAEWGGAGIDPEKGIIYINSNEMAWLLQLEQVEEIIKDVDNAGIVLYNRTCRVCHGKEMAGNPSSGYPSLLNVKDKYQRSELLDIVKNGKGRMPGFPGWSESEYGAIIDYISKIDNNTKENKSLDEVKSFTYQHTGYHKFLDQNGLPALDPPWGTLNAIDMNTGQYLWKQNFGEVDSLMELGHPATGTENYGGPIITQNGLLIIAATKDAKARIYNRFTGELLWSDRLPAASFATPATYQIDNEQFIVFACGGEKLGTDPGNKLVAYALKR